MTPKTLFVLLGWLVLLNGLAAQTLTVDAIAFNGLKRTKLSVAEREMNLRTGDTIHLSNLQNRLDENELLLLNSSLFNAVEINVADWDQSANRIALEVRVEETNYFYVAPIAALVDRNLNVWWEEFGGSLRRVNFGGIAYHTNLTGRRDNLKAMAQFGFSQRYQLRYRLPGINRAQTIGLEVEGFLQRNRELGFDTRNNILAFQRTDDRFLLRRLRTSATLLYRPGLRVRHRFAAQFRRFRIDPFLQELNPDFLANGTLQRYFSLAYSLETDQTDVRPYPTAGYRISGELRKDGLGAFDDGVNSATLRATVRKFFPLTEKWSGELSAGGKYQFIREQQPYYLLSRALGYDDDYLRGYELYVTDGQDFVFGKQTLRYRLFDKTFSVGKIMPLKNMRSVPWRLYLKAYADQGYVNNPYYADTNDLSNRWLRSYGLGVDLVLYYNFVFQFELSRNDLKETGLFIHIETSF